MTIMRVIAVAAAIVAIIFFIVGASNGNPKDIDYGLAAVAVAVGALALDPAIGRPVA